MSHIDGHRDANESVCLTGLGNNVCNMKALKLASPYESTILNGRTDANNIRMDASCRDATLQHRDANTKPMMMEPTYATVKRTAARARNEGTCVYREYPCTINGATGLVTIATEGASNCCETDSCLSYEPDAMAGVCNNGGGGQAAFLRLQEGSEHLLNGHHY